LTKLVRSEADVVVADLEDGVPAEDSAKAEARKTVAGWLTESTWPAPAPPVLIRINAVGGEWIDDDLLLARSQRVAGIAVPKSTDASSLLSLQSRLKSVENGRSLAVLAGIETAEGVANVEGIARSQVIDAIYFGAEDYISDIGGRRTPNGQEVLYARSRVALAASLGGIPAIDQVVTEFLDDELFLADGAIGRDLGFQGKMCIHPRQVPLANGLFSLTAVEMAAARRILEAADLASLRGRGVVSVDGRMIDAPLVERARKVLSATEQRLD
jgi:citrate lyase subunit beta/citryl-CoA lyase